MSVQLKPILALQTEGNESINHKKYAEFERLIMHADLGSVYRLCTH